VACALATVGPGMAFGEMAFLSGAPRTACAGTEHGKARLVRLARADFDAWAQQHPQAALTVMNNLAQIGTRRLAATTRQFARGVGVAMRRDRRCVGHIAAHTPTKNRPGGRFLCAGTLKGLGPGLQPSVPRSFFSSPDSYISIMMSEPPMNSPLM
jgi:hypothetical protein